MLRLQKNFNSISLSFLFTLHGVIFLFSACSLQRTPPPASQDQTTIKRDPENQTEQEIFRRILIANGKEENFSLLQRKGNEFLMDNQIRIHSSTQVRQPIQDCQSPNFMTQYENHIYLVCSLSHSIQILDKENLQIKRSFLLEKNSNPWAITILDAKKAYVSSWLKNSILVIDPSIHEVPKRILGEIPLESKSLALENDGKETKSRPQTMVLAKQKLYVALSNLNQNFISGGPGYVAVIDTQTDKVQSLIKSSGRGTGSIHVFPIPESKEMGSPKREKVFALNAGTFEITKNGEGFKGNGSVDILDPETDQREATIPLEGAPAGMAVDPKKSIAYLANMKEGKILRFDLVTKNILPPIDAIQNRCRPVVPPEANHSYISSLFVLDEFLFATEFNSNCLLGWNLKEEKMEVQLRTGSGPVNMFAIDTR